MIDTDARHTPNGIAHFDIAGPQVAALGSFYSDVFGWSVSPRGPGYAAVVTPEGSPDGALVEAQESGLTLGVVVADIAETLARAVAGGGSVAMPITDNGWVVKAQVLDPAGNRLTLIAA
jgi:predicted enzyme related to lactoylglutathione lyase